MNRKVSDAERIAGRYMVDENGCWLWTGRIDAYGYGRRGTHTAHAASYRAHFGPVPAGLEIDHLCRVRHCINPAHLEAVTHAENVRRAAPPPGRPRRTAIPEKCSNGHNFAENAYTRPDGHHTCRACNRESVRQYRNRKAVPA